MSGTTSVYGLPYLELDDAPDIAGISQAISEAVEAQIARLDAAGYKRVQSGEESISFSGQPSFTKTVTFPAAFSTAPRVTGNIASGFGGAAQWTVRCYTATTTQFTLTVSGPSASTWSGVPVQWIAVAP